MILAVNAAEELLQVVLGDQDGVSLAFEEVCPGRMNEVLAPVVADLLGRAGLAPADLAAVACVRGPGSFTGVRLALAFCHGLAIAAGLPLAGLDYLPLLAASAARRFGPDKEELGEKPAGGRDGGPAQAPAHAPDRGLAQVADKGAAHVANRGEIHVLTHSRRDKVYRQGFRLPDLALLAPASDEPVLSSALLLSERAARGPVYVLGSGLVRNPRILPQPLDGPASVTRLDPAADNPAAETLLAAALAAPRTGPPVDALYLRGSDAEENLDAIALKRGLDPKEARRRLEAALKKEK